MNKSKLLSLLSYTISLLCACSQSGNHALTREVVGNDTVYACDLSQVSDEVHTLKLSELIDSFRIVRFENSDIALFKTWKVYITEHHIGILQDASLPFKLFDHAGNFLCDVGGVGQGPGEYNNLYSGAIDEQHNAIWLAPFSGNRLWKYNLQGECTATFSTLPLRKPSLRTEEDGTVTLTNLYFQQMPGFLHLRCLGNDSVHYSVHEKHHSISPRDKDGNFMGFNHEVWFYNNAKAFTYMTTASDTLLVYDLEEDKTRPRLYRTSPKPVRGYYVFDELASSFLIREWTEDNGLRLFLADKSSGEVRRIAIKNDFFCGLPVTEAFSPREGWFYQMFEPLELVDAIKKYLENGKADSEERQQLQKHLSEIDEEGNNILFMGRLKI